MERRLLALDQSSRCSGWAIFINNELKDYGIIELTTDDIGQRLVTLKEQIIDLINKNNINEIAFEDIQLQSSIQNNVHTFKVLAEVFGIVHALCTELKIDYTIVPAVTWKSTLGIKGKKRQEQKQDAQRYVLETYNIKAIQDSVDAICIGTHMLKNPGKNTVIFDSGLEWGE